jgi:hypothetical protein
MSTTSSRNFTTLYSGAGSAVAQGAYGNANVVSLLNVGTDGGNTVGNITATGAITTTGTMSATGNITGGNINTATVTATTLNGNLAGGTVTASTISASGNITTAGYFIGNFAGNITGNLTVPGANTQVLYNNNGNAGASAGFTFDSAANVFSTPGTITAIGNITAPYFLGNGSQLTGLPATYSNANVAAFMAAYGSNTISSTGNITTTANVSGGFILGNGSQLTGIGGTYSNANVASFMAAFGSNTISSTGNITTTANIAGGFFLGNGSQLTGIGSTYGNANVADFLGNGFGSNTITTTGNITTGNLLTGGLISATGNITGGNIRSAVFQAVNSAGGVLRNASGTNQLQWGSGGGDNLSLDVSTNITGANAQINISPTGNSGHVHIKPTGTPSVEIAPTFTGSVNNMIIGNITPAAVSATTVSATGNITGANLVATANLTSTQQTVVGTANTGTTGNIVMSGRNIATDMAYQPDGQTSPALYYGKIMIGTGFNGNNNLGTASRLASWDAIMRGNTSTQVRQFDVETQVSLTGNVTNGSFRQQGLGARVRIGGGSAGNSITLAGGGGQNSAVAAFQPNLDVGNVSPYNLGNASVSHCSLNAGFVTLHPGGSIGNVYGFMPGIIAGSTGNAATVGNLTNYIGFTTNMSGPPSVVGNLYHFYHPAAVGTAEATATGLSVGNAARSAPNYYAFRNDDAVAQVKLGSLRSYNEFQYATATSGTVNIDKTNAQVQFVAPTANVTIGDFQNFVTTANDGTNNDTQTDTVTLIIQQGATPYTVTMPTGNAAIKYAANVTTVSTTANSVTMVSITAFRSSANAAIYLTTVSPGFV